MKTSVQRGRCAEVPALVLAAHAGREAEVEALLASGSDVNAGDGDGITPLMAAAMSGNLPLAKALLAAGAESRARNKWGMSAQAIARWHGYEALAELLSKMECRRREAMSPHAGRSVS